VPSPDASLKCCQPRKVIINIKHKFYLLLLVVGDITSSVCQLLLAGVHIIGLEKYCFAGVSSTNIDLFFGVFFTSVTDRLDVIDIFGATTFRRLAGETLGSKGLSRNSSKLTSDGELFSFADAFFFFPLLVFRVRLFRAATTAGIFRPFAAATGIGSETLSLSTFVLIFNFLLNIGDIGTNSWSSTFSPDFFSSI
jgi:hypothetical protein